VVPVAPVAPVVPVAPVAPAIPDVSAAVPVEAPAVSALVVDDMAEVSAADVLASLALFASSFLAQPARDRPAAKTALAAIRPIREVLSCI
jgi:hypothetical protein